MHGDQHGLCVNKRCRVYDSRVANSWKIETLREAGSNRAYLSGDSGLERFLDGGAVPGERVPVGGQGVVLDRRPAHTR